MEKYRDIRSGNNKQDLRFGGWERHGLAVLSSMVWADNFWLFSNSREQLQTMMNQLVEELEKLDMEPKKGIAMVDENLSRRAGSLP